MLLLDEREAQRRKIQVTTVQASMDDLSMLTTASFDIVHQPVSTCYVPDVTRVYAEIARVLRPGGLYISQHKQPTSLQIAGRDHRDAEQDQIERNHEAQHPQGIAGPVHGDHRARHDRDRARCQHPAAL